MLPEKRDEVAFGAGFALGVMVTGMAAHAYLSMAMVQEPAISLRGYLWIMIVPALAASVVLLRRWSRGGQRQSESESA